MTRHEADRWVRLLRRVTGSEKTPPIPTRRSGGFTEATEQTDERPALFVRLCDLGAISRTWCRTNGGARVIYSPFVTISTESGRSP
jgi:hypothetical protein